MLIKSSKAMKKIRVFFIFSYLIPIFYPLLPVSFSQISPSEIGILFRLQQILEFPPVLDGWTKATNFCYYPSSPYLKISCSGNHVTELTIVGNKNFSSSPSQGKTPKNFTTSAQTLSEKFSSDSFFTTVTKLSSLKVLSLVALGIWGPFPGKINRLRSLEVLNLSSNSMYGAIPSSISSLENLRSLVLEHNLLNGTVPDLSGLVVLEELNLGNNLLGPKFPSMGSNIISLVLRNNIFHSEIPDDTSRKFEQLQRLDISYNQFVGAIPPDLFSLPSIKQLNLAGNEFRGALQVNSKCSDTLEFVDLSHNLLNGNIPACITSNSSSRTVVYSWNCLANGNLKHQYPSSFCYEKALAVKPPIQLQKKEKSKPKLALILGVIGAIVAGIGISIFLVLGVIPKLRAWKGENKAFGMVATSKKASVDARHVPPVTKLGLLGLPPYHIFSSEEIEEATNNFDPSNLIEDGSHGQLYKGWLGDGSAMVIRCFKHKQTHSYEILTRSVEAISKLQHQNLVSILGHCLVTDQDEIYEAGTVFLVFEYISNHTLRSYLTDWRKRDMMKWSHRMTVITGIAKGIQFLHTGISPGMFGNNLNAENILLDDNLTAKINSYHLPLLTKVGTEGTSNIAETPYSLTGSVQGEKEDIYQLGIILLEVITGKIITTQTELDPLRIQMQQSLTDLPSKLKGLADTSIQSTFAHESVKITIEIAINCLSKRSSERPSIEDVLWNLQYAAQMQDAWTPSGENLSSRESYSSI